MDYHVVAQGKTTIPHVDDGEEFQLTDVRHSARLMLTRLCFNFYFVATKFCSLSLQNILSFLRILLTFTLTTRQIDHVYFMLNGSSSEFQATFLIDFNLESS